MDGRNPFRVILKPRGAIVFLVISKGFINPGFLRCEMDFAHPQYAQTIFVQTSLEESVLRPAERAGSLGEGTHGSLESFAQNPVVKWSSSQDHASRIRADIRS